MKKGGYLMHVVRMRRFTCELNEHEEGVAPTDSRLRPDQRLMEEGLWDEANTEKVGHVFFFFLQTRTGVLAVMQIGEDLFRIRIRGTVIMTYESGSRRPINYRPIRILPGHFCAQ
jgi:hypothetical protein